MSAPHAGAFAQLRTAVRYCLQRSRLRLTVPIGLLVGAVLSLANTGSMLLDGTPRVKRARARALVQGPR